MAKIELKGTIDKVVRANGKVGATLMITVPLSAATELPLGDVNLTIQPLQESLFAKAGKEGIGAIKVTIGKTAQRNLKGVVTRGDRG